MMTINNYQIKTSGVVRESADILSTRIRMDSLCICLYVCLFVWRNRTVSFPRGSLFSVLFCIFVLHRVKQRRDSPRRGSPSPFRFSLRILSIILSSHREYSPILEQNDVHGIPCCYMDTGNHVSSRQTNRTFQMRSRILLRESS